MILISAKKEIISNVGFMDSDLWKVIRPKRKCFVICKDDGVWKKIPTHPPVASCHLHIKFKLCCLTDRSDRHPYHIYRH